VLTGNRSSSNQGDGFSWGGTGTVLRNNIASSNGSDGFQVQGVKSLIGNKSFKNVYEGIKIVSGDGIVVKANKAHDNGYNGIRFLAGDGDKAINNVTNHNGFANGAPDGFGDGIFVESGVTNFFGKGNKAKNNDDQFQCSAAAHCTP
jgi:parallel beta-helix repeat protein